MKEVQSKEFKPIEPASLASRLSQLVQPVGSAKCKRWTQPQS